MVKEVYPVKGMSCAACANSVETILKAQQGVEKVQVNYVANNVLIEYDPETVSLEELGKQIDSIGYDLVVGASPESLKQEEVKEYLKQKTGLVVSLIFTMPVFILSMFVGDFPFKNILLLVLTLPVIFYSGWHFYVSAWKKLKHRKTNMDTLISLGTGAAFLFSLFNTFFPAYLLQWGLEPHVYYESATVIITLILIGNLLETRAKKRSTGAIQKLIGFQPKKARAVMDDKEIDVYIEDIRTGDMLVIRPGDKVPVDGIVIKGASTVNESMVTGESLGIEKRAGDKVLAGTINENGSFQMEATGVGSQTLLSRIIEMVRQAQGSKAEEQKLADKVTAVFVPVVILIAIFSFVIWMVFGPEPTFTHAFVILVSVLIIACPCALGLATPTAVTIGIGKAASMGILVKDASALSKSREMNVLCIDKTGTITEGKPQVIKWQLSENGNQADEDYLKEVVLNLERHSTHPLANAIVTYLEAQGFEASMEIINFENLTGTGIRGKVKNETFMITSLKYIQDNGVVLTAEFKDTLNEWANDLITIVVVVRDGTAVAAFGIGDKIKENAARAVEGIHSENISIVMLTGDSEQVASYVADKVNIDVCYAEVYPEKKLEIITDYQNKNYIVGMAGDGINDAPALAKANVGIAMGDGTDVAMETAPITILKGDLTKILKMIQLSKATNKTIRQNLFWAFFYNVVAIPVAAGILYPINGFLLSPMIAGGAMVFSSLSVVLNSLRLARKKI
ncbi:MAG: copper-translocating P-type ATPase [Bacteroidetes bacterium]|nr:copper-translocating P-type ATPase [Bacteroidota bacterium]